MSRTITITDHAVAQWRERLEGEARTTGPDLTIRKVIAEAFATSRPVRLRNPMERARKAVNNGAIATYHHAQGAVLVLAGDWIVTVYLYEKYRWECVPAQGAAS